ncbi:MAG: HD domain-containing protein [Candidatus Baltobacteraceae bacterium]
MYRPNPLDRLLVDLLPAHSLYAVGGRVRDEVRSRLEGREIPVKDLDYVAVGVSLEELVARLAVRGRTDVVGASFAVVKWTSAGTTVDVALPRRERSTGLGHRDFAVETGPDVSLEDDLARRDFRMNMLARAIPDGTLVDPYGGVADIRARRVGLLRNAAFVEDPLRMLRAAQFAARFDYEIASGTMAAMREAASLVATVSPERIRDELLKLLLAARPSRGFEYLRDSGVLAFVLPEVAAGIAVEQNEWHAYDVYRHNLETLDATPPGDVTLRLAALLHDVAKPQTKDGPHFYRHEIVGEGVVRALLDRLRFPAEEVATVAGLVRHHMYVADPEASSATLRRFVRRVGPEQLDRLFALRAADIAGSGLPKRDDANERFEARVAAVLAERPPFAVRDLAVGGADVLAALVAARRLPAGSRGGPRVGQILRALLDQVLEDPAANQREELLARIRTLATEAPPHSDSPRERSTRNFSR